MVVKGWIQCACAALHAVHWRFLGQALTFQSVCGCRTLLTKIRFGPLIVTFAELLLHLSEEDDRVGVYKVTIADRPGNGGGTEVDQLLYFSLRPDQINLLFLLKHVAQLLFYIYFFRSVGRSILRRKSPSNNINLVWP